MSIVMLGKPHSHATFVCYEHKEVKSAEHITFDAEPYGVLCLELGAGAGSCQDSVVDGYGLCNVDDLKF